MGIIKMIMVRILIGILLSGTSLYGQIEWAQQVVESTMQRSPSGLNRWAYPAGFYLFGQYRIWKEIGNDDYFTFIDNYVDAHIDDNGNIDTNIGSLDNSQPGLVTLLCYVETGNDKYKLAADYIRDVYTTYPRTSDGGFWHNTSLEGQLWLDGVYMILPFLVKYGQVFNDTTLYTEAANQIIIYASHLEDTSGLLYHAYDEDGSSNWADPVTHHSPYFWGRSIGWFGMAIVEILDIIPENHPKRPQLIEILANLIEGLLQNQDADSGLWYQVVNQGQRTDNWLESSCSCMYTYFTAKAIDKGYVDSTYKNMVLKAYEGILRDKVYVDTDGLTNLKDISEGTGVSNDIMYYLNRSKNTNDLHGLGAFLMMCWQLEISNIGYGANVAPIINITSPTDSSFYWPNTNVTISANSFDIDGSVVSVKFYEGDNLLYTDNQSPWEFTWENVPKGDYILTAEAIDDSNAAAISPSIHIFVSDKYIIFEAEQGFMSEGSVDNNHQGYTGTGFVNLVNQQGTYLELTADIPDSGMWELSLRYANGTTDNRPCEIRVDGNIVESNFDFLPTGEWTDWDYSGALSMNLTMGEHTFRITGNTSVSAPNLDHLKFEYIDNQTSIKEKSEFSAKKFKLFQNFPNPFNPKTVIRYALPVPCHIDLSIYNILGQKVATLVNKKQPVGRYEVEWDATNLASGIYLYQLETDRGLVQTRKLIVLK